MAKTRAIVKRRKAIRNIRKITRTMELIATARFKKAMDRAVEAAAYTRKLSEIVADLGRSGASASHPLLEDRPEVRSSRVLILTSNRGLCGGYNANVLKAAVQVVEKSPPEAKLSFEVSGKRGIAFCKFRKIATDRTFTQFEDKPSFAEVEELADRYIDEFIHGRLDQLKVVYTRFLSAGKQVAVSETLLPMKRLAAEGSEGGDAKQEVAYDFLPSAEDILKEIVPASFKASLFKCFLDSAVSEQIARMVAMKGATENAGDLIRGLTLRYNRARQSQITSEIAEIIGTVEALK